MLILPTSLLLVVHHDTYDIDRMHLVWMQSYWGLWIDRTQLTTTCRNFWISQMIKCKTQCGSEALWLPERMT